MAYRKRRAFNLGAPSGASNVGPTGPPEEVHALSPGLPVDASRAPGHVAGLVVGLLGPAGSAGVGSSALPALLVGRDLAVVVVQHRHRCVDEDLAPNRNATADKHVAHAIVGGASDARVTHRIHLLSAGHLAGNRTHGIPSRSVDRHVPGGNRCAVPVDVRTVTAHRCGSSGLPGRRTFGSDRAASHVLPVAGVVLGLEYPRKRSVHCVVQPVGRRPGSLSSRVVARRSVDSNGIRNFVDTVPGYLRRRRSGVPKVGTENLEGGLRCHELPSLRTWMPSSNSTA